MRFLIAFVVFLSVGCTTVSIKAEGAVDLIRPGQPVERADLIAYTNESVSGVAALCFFTGLLYGGGCWAYLAYPTADERAAFEKAVTESINGAGSCAKVAFLRSDRYSWNKEIERIELVDRKRRTFTIDRIKSLCANGPKYRVDPKTELPIQRDKYSVNAGVNCDDEGCKSFTLRVENNTDGPLAIDWSKTQFIDHDQTRGVFMFEGVRYMDKNQMQAPAIVLPKGKYEQELFPAILVANPTSETSWQHQSLAAGSQGLAITIDVDGATFFETVVFDLTPADASPKEARSGT